MSVKTLKDRTMMSYLGVQVNRYEVKTEKTCGLYWRKKAERRNVKTSMVLLYWCFPIMTDVTFRKELKTWRSKSKVMNSELVIILTMGRGTSKWSLCGDRGLRNSSVTLESAATQPRSSLIQTSTTKEIFNWTWQTGRSSPVSCPRSLINQIKGFQQWQIALQSQG